MCIASLRHAVFIAGAARRALAGLVNAKHIEERITNLEKLVRIQQAKGVTDRAKLLQNWCFVGPPGISGLVY